MNPHDLSRRDLRRLVQDMWADPRCDEVCHSALDAAALSGARSIERALITAYLRHFPVRHQDFAALRNLVGNLAERSDWPWRERGRRWQLWDAAEGPNRMANALLNSDDPVELLRSAGLDGDLTQGRYVVESVGMACELASQSTGDIAEVHGRRLMLLAQEHTAGQLDAKILQALLSPWRREHPADKYRALLLSFLVSRFGDPRFEQGKWEILLQDAAPGNWHDLFALVRRWMTERTVRQFFDVVGLTTGDSDQWEERRAFWEDYLHAGAIKDAWFALGTDAEAMIISKTSDLSGQYATIVGGRQYADPSHSSLIMVMDGLRIAEWSHSGACRFWLEKDPKKPEPYVKQYFGIQLRAMNGGKGFEHISHVRGWQYRFAGKVFEVTGKQHPKFAAGHRVRGLF